MTVRGVGLAFLVQTVRVNAARTPVPPAAITIAAAELPSPGAG